MMIYLAGPDVYFPDAMARAEAKKALVLAAGAQALFPLDASLGAEPIEVDVEGHPPAQTARAIFQANVDKIRRCDAVLANLTPFRGPSADAGTVWEVGFAYALGKRVWGYSTVAAPFAARTRAHLAGAPDGLDVEDFGLQADNLMIACALEGFVAVEPADRWADVTAFRVALKGLLGA